VEGQFRFLKRLWAYGQARRGTRAGADTARLGTSCPQLRGRRRQLHLHLKQARDDYERGKYNTVVSAAMKMLNALEDAPLDDSAASIELAREGLSLLLRILNPVAPHIAHVLWKELGYAARHGDILDAPWPEVDAAALAQEEIELVLQINGKLRGKLRVPAAADSSAIQRAAIASPGAAARERRDASAWSSCPGDWSMSWFDMRSALGPGPGSSPGQALHRGDRFRHSRASGNPVTFEPKTLGPRLCGDDRPAFQSRFARLVVALALLGGPVACGFHLRGEANYSFDTLYLSPAAGQPFTTDLKRSLEGGGTAKLVGSADSAQAILDITAVENNKQILSLTSGGKVSEFLLTKRIVFRVHDKEGNDWLPSSEIVIRRTHTYSDTAALAKGYEEQRLWRDMQDDAVQLIVRRLQSAKKPVA
jgi:outer membrane lipopolysaccharide assembly protein LptE/RlpB